MDPGPVTRMRNTKPLIECQLDVLYLRDRNGRLVVTRDVDARPAPRLHLGRSGEVNVWALRRDLDAPLAQALADVCARERPLAAPSPDGAPACRERVRELLAPVEGEIRGPAYVLPRVLPRDDRARVLSVAEAFEYREVFPWLASGLASIQPVAMAFADGEPASLCHSPRGWTPVAAEAGVETREPFRGRGLATAAVACWARAVQATGRLALYSTSWSNRASRAVACGLSARLYGEDWQVL